jgi:hypothetical protein
MKAYPAKGVLIFTGFFLIISCAACSPKYLAKGRVLDAETHKPIKGAAVAIRWLAVVSAQEPEKTITFDAYQTLSNDEGVFQFPEYPEKKYILGVYKDGYICWSNQDIFPIDPLTTGADEYRKRKKHHFSDGMQIELKPFKKEGSSRGLHAGFTVMVAGESTDTHDGPFHQAIESEYRIWRESLRRDFKEQFGKKRESATRPTAK